jgi:hypothetical protein
MARDYTFTFALECTAVVTAASREDAIKQLILATRSGSTADLWRPFDGAAAERGEPAQGVQGASIRRIGSIA